MWACDARRYFVADAIARVEAGEECKAIAPESAQMRLAGERRDDDWIHAIAITVDGDRRSDVT